MKASIIVTENNKAAVESLSGKEEAIGDKVYFKSAVTNNTITIEGVIEATYKIRKESIADLKLLHKYVIEVESADNLYIIESVGAAELNAYHTASYLLRKIISKMVGGNKVTKKIAPELQSKLLEEKAAYKAMVKQAARALQVIKSRK